MSGLSVAGGTVGWRERLAQHPGSLPELDMDESRTALLLVDMQNYAANAASEQGELFLRRQPEMAGEYFGRVQDVVIPNQQRLLSFWRQHSLRVVYTTAGAFLPDGTDMTLRRQRRDGADIAGGVAEHRHPGVEDYQIVEELRPEPGEMVIPKNSVGAFNSSPIDQVLRNFGITGLVIAGVVTEACVESTAREAGDRGYECILVEDGTASTMGRETQEASLLSFARGFGDVHTTDEVLARFETALG